jgi:DNA-binding NarL/FixJ family response regulator
MGPIAVFVFSAIPLFTESLLIILNSESDLKVIGNSDNIPGVLNQFKIRIPDIFNADDSCVEKSEFIDFTTAILKSPAGRKTIVFTGSNNALYLGELVNQGIRAIVHKKSGKEIIFDAINMIDLNAVFFDDFIHYSISKYKIEAKEKLKKLSNSEITVLKLIFKGMGNIEIAEKLSISVKTVESHKENIKKKYGINSMKELYKLALEN